MRIMLVIGRCNRTLDRSCLCMWTVIASPACAVVRHFTELTAVFLRKCVTDV